MSGGRLNAWEEVYRAGREVVIPVRPPVCPWLAWRPQGLVGLGEVDGYGLCTGAHHRKRGSRCRGVVTRGRCAVVLLRGPAPACVDVQGACSEYVKGGRAAPDLAMRPPVFW